MRHSYIDEYADLGSFIQGLEPRVKVISFFLFIIFVITTPLEIRQLSGLARFGWYGLLIALLILLSGIPFGYVFKRSLVAVPFLLAATIFIPFLAKDGANIYSFGGFKLALGQKGLIIFLNYLARAYLSILAMVLLTASTRFSDLLKALERLRLPSVFLMVISFMYRYIFIFVDELMSMKQAMESRSFKAPGWLQVKVFANMVGTLFIRAYERAENVYLAMCSRGFDGKARTLYDFRLKFSDICFLFIMVLSLIGIRIFGA